VFETLSVEVDKKERMMRLIRWAAVFGIAVLLFAGLYLGGHKL
jgi:hypothetical protein